MGGGPEQPAQWAAVGGGTAPDLRRPSQWWKAPLPGMPFRHPHRGQRRPAWAQAVGPVLGPHARTDRTRDTRVAEPRLPAPEDGRPGENSALHQTPLTTVAGHPPRQWPPTITAARSPHRACGPRGQCWAPTPRHPAHSRWVADPNSPRSGRAVGGGTAPDLRRPSQWWKAPPPGDALPPAPQRATPARKGARCGASAGCPRPHRPHPGHTGHGTLAARSRGRAAG